VTVDNSVAVAIIEITSSGVSVMSVIERRGIKGV